MKVYWDSKKFEEGEYEAVLQVMEIKPSPFDENSSGWKKCGDRPLCYVTLRFEILDGSPSPADPCDYLEYIEFYPAPYSALDRMIKLVGGGGDTTVHGTLRSLLAYVEPPPGPSVQSACRDGN